MVRVLGVDHLVVSVGDFQKSKAFDAPLMAFLGFEVEAEYEGMMGWANGKTLFWIAAADAEGRKHNTAKAISAFTTMPSACAAGRMSTHCKRSSRAKACASSIPPANITTTITLPSSSIPTA